jgi:hypothetical protein
MIAPQGSTETAMTTLEINLPDRLAKEAREAGLLAPEAIEKLIADALRDRAFDELLSVADRVEAAGVPPMSMDEINAEIKAYRMERRRDGH